jgi:minor histocompatibility antigen H13
MLTTLAVLKIYNHAQPALLYLVPGVLIALWGTALVRGELPLMWAYTEDGSLDDPTDESKDPKVEPIEGPKEMPQAELTQTNNQRTYNDDDLSSFASSSEDGSDSEGS